MKKNSLIMLFGLVAIGSYMEHAVAEIYKHVDENGRITYSVEQVPDSKSLGSEPTEQKVATNILEKTNSQPKGLTSKTNTLSVEQKGYCAYLADEWSISCNSIKKIKFHSDKNRKIVIGCQGPGIPVQHCGGKAYFYTRVNATINQCTNSDVENIPYDEEWSYSSKDGSNTIYWRKGEFVYEGNMSKHFSGFDTKQQHFKESLGKGRQWFVCEISPRIK